MSRRTSSALLATCTAVAIAGVSAPADAAAAAPSVTSLSVTAGPAAGGTRVHVAGTNFANGATVRFGTTLYGTSVNVTSSKSLWVTAPAHAPATADVRVHTSTGWSPITTKDRYTWVAAPTVVGLSPSAAPTEGGTTVTIYGTNFTTTTSVSFGTVPATSVEFVSAAQLSAVAPAHEFGTVHVTVTNSFGRSASTTNDRFDYLGTPDPVPNATVADVTATTVTLRWDTPAPPAKGITVRRIEGATPPASPTDGEFVTSVNLLHNSVLDQGLEKDTTYTYAIYAYEYGPVYSAPRTLTVATAHNSRPDIPTGLTTSPATRGGAGSCSAQPYGAVGALGGAPLTLAARVSDPDGAADQVTTRFRLWDLGASGTDAPVSVADGTDGPRSGAGYTAIYRVADTGITDGHLYRWNAVADDGSSTGATANSCYFRADFSAPTGPVITSSDTTFEVGTPTTFDFASSEVSPANGLPSGFDHFGYAFDSPTGFRSATPTITGDRADFRLTFTPTVWGTTTLFVIAVDRAGNTSTVASRQFYVQS